MELTPMVVGRILLSLAVAGAVCWTAASREAAPRAAPAPPRTIVANLDPTPAAPIPGRQDSPADPPAAPDQPEPAAPRAADLAPMNAAAAAYLKSGLAAGDALAKAVDDPLQRVALEWIALKSSPQADYARLAAFEAANPGWPASAWIRERREAAIYNDRAHPDAALTQFAADPPRTPVGRLALARAARSAGRLDEAARLVRGVWRDDDLDGWTEGAILREFAPLLTGADHRRRAVRLLYQERIGPALRAAALAGPETFALAKVWAGALAHPLADAAWDALPAAMREDPDLLFVRVQGLRRAERVLEAAQLIRSASHGAAVIDGDRWWDERRMIARRLLDAGLAKDAYRLCAENAAVAAAARVDAEFHAGWIALRFLDDPRGASVHFAAAAAVAQTPLAIARAGYWRGRAAEAAGRADDARGYYEEAAAYPIAYYGQLAGEKLGRPAFALRAPTRVAAGETREEATRVVELLYAARLDGFAHGLAFDAARSFTDEAQLAALAEVVAERRDGPASVAIGKQATQRGFALDETAFPTYGVPGFEPLTRSADLAAVYSIARQESEFAESAASGAGAKGLMQILPATARDTARRLGVPFDLARLIGDPAYNIQLGAAFLGQLIDDEGGSYVLALAAYNAGAGRVQQWIGTYGDPRDARVDPVDWVERIPFDETRDYVQRVSENLRVYRARLGDLARAPIEPLTGRTLRVDL
jgi:soluble lytic murein transglycosylase